MVGEDVSEERIHRFRGDLLDWSRGQLRSFPWREESATPYEVLIAEILLQRTRVDAVLPVYTEFLERYPDFTAITDASTGEIADLLQPLGLQNRRANSLSKLAESMAGREVPRTEDELLELPHVGLYVANAVLSFALDEPTAIVDSNVIRVYQRVFDIGEVRPRKKELWEFARRVLPREEHRRFNLAVLDFAALECTPSSPNCERCFAARYCYYPEK